MLFAIPLSVVYGFFSMEEDIGARELKLKIQAYKFKMGVPHRMNRYKWILIYEDRLLVKDKFSVLYSENFSQNFYIESKDKTYRKISYRDWYIENAGTLYGNGWSISFAPVTGFLYFHSSER